MFKNRYTYKIVAGILSLAMIFAMSITSFASTGKEVTPDAISNQTITIRAHQFVVIADVLNVRSGPGTSYSIVGQLYEGDTVWLDPTEDSTYADGHWWVKIFNDDVTGWVAVEYIENIS